MNNFIEIYENALSNESCDEIINYFEKLNDRCFVLKTPRESHRQDDYFVNLSYHYDLKNWDKVGEICFSSMKFCVEQYLEKYSILRNSDFLMFDIKMKRIPIGGGFHDWHFESRHLQTSNRIVNVQIYLNDVTEGGETEFLYIPKRIQPKKGNIAIYPAGFTHTHRGNPPISNDKYIINSWLLIQAH